MPTKWAALDVSLRSRLVGSEMPSVVGIATEMEKILLFRVFVKPPKLTTELGFIAPPERKLPLGSVRLCAVELTLTG